LGNYENRKAGRKPLVKDLNREEIRMFWSVSAARHWLARACSPGLAIKCQVSHQGEFDGER